MPDRISPATSPTTNPITTSTKPIPTSTIAKVDHQRPFTSANERRNALVPTSPSTISAGTVTAHEISNQIAGTIRIAIAAGPMARYNRTPAVASGTRYTMSVHRSRWMRRSANPIDARISGRRPMYASLAARNTNPTTIRFTASVRIAIASSPLWYAVRSRK